MSKQPQLKAEGCGVVLVAKFKEYGAHISYNPLLFDVDGVSAFRAVARAPGHMIASRKNGVGCDCKLPASVQGSSRSRVEQQWNLLGSLFQAQLMTQIAVVLQFPRLVTPRENASTAGLRRSILGCIKKRVWAATPDNWPLRRKRCNQQPRPIKIGLRSQSGVAQKV